MPRRIDHCSEHGSWTLYRWQPPAALAPYVIEVQGYYEESAQPVVRKELPSSVVPLILVIGPGFTLHDPNGRARPRTLGRSFIAGLHEVPVLVGSGGRAVCMQVDLTPVGAWRLLGVDMHDLAGQVIDLRDVLDIGDELENSLADAKDWPARFALLEGILCRRILNGRQESPVVGTAFAAIARTNGRASIGGLAKTLGCSRKHLVTLFKREVGLPPKSVARLARFGHAIQHLQHGAFESLSDLAAACDYADQAHFNRDFRAFAGECPTTLLARVLQDGTGIIDALR
jgi:AraC-like DNA-binding protein